MYISSAGQSSEWRYAYGLEFGGDWDVCILQLEGKGPASNGPRYCYLYKSSHNLCLVQSAFYLTHQ